MSTQPLYERSEAGADERGPSWSVRRNARGVVVCRPRYFALAERADPKWYEAEVAKNGQLKTDIMQGEAWDAPAGTPYLPLFAERVHEVAPWKFEGWYIRDAPCILPKLTVRVGLDGGLHRPAAIMGQYDDGLGMLWAMREFRPLTPSGLPMDMQAHEFVAVLRFLLGLATEDMLAREERENRWSTAAALSWIAQERRQPFYGWTMPWIKPGTEGVRFLFSMMRHEVQRKDQLAATKGLNSLRKVYAQQGIPVRDATAGWEQRELALSFLLREGPKQGVSRLLVDSSCKTLAKGMAGGLIAAQPGSRKPYVEDRYFEDPFDAFLNMMAGAAPLAHADRISAMEFRQAKEREEKNRPAETGIQRDRQPSAPAGRSWGGVRDTYVESGHAW